VPAALTAAAGDFTSEKVPFRDGQGLRLDAGNKLLLTAARTTRLDLSTGFTIEAVIVPRSVSDSGAVRAIAAQGVTGKKEGSWQFGITGLKSRRAPMVLVLQCHGELADGRFGEAVYFSNLRLTMHKPYYVAAALTFAQADRRGQVTFTLKDLANDDEPLLHDQVAGQLARLDTGTHPFHPGGKHGEPEGFFHGVIDDLRLSSGALPAERLLFSAEEAQPTTLGFWRFENKTGLMKDSSGHGRDLAVEAGRKAATTGADRTPLAALCHALLNSSEFLYVE